MSLADKVARVSKAVAGAITGGAAAFAVAIQDGQVTGPEWITISLAVLAGAGIVFGAPANKVGGSDGTAT